MVAVRLQRRGFPFAQAGLGRAAETGGVADDQIGAIADQRAVEGLVLAPDVADDRAAVVVAPLQQLVAHAVGDGLLLIGRDAALPLAPGQVQVDAVQANGVGLGARPVSHHHAALATGGRDGGHVAVVHQPAVEVGLGVELRKAVVGEDDDLGLVEQIALAQALFDAADQLVQVFVPLVDEIGPVAEEHMLDAVERVEDAGQHALVKAVDLVHEHVFAQPVDVLAQGQELLVVDAAVLEGGGVLRPADGREGAAIFPHLADEVARRAIGPGRGQGVDLQREGVEADVRAVLDQDDLRHSLDRQDHVDLERHLEQRAPLAQLQVERLLADRDAGGLGRGRLDGDIERRRLQTVLALAHGAGQLAAVDLAILAQRRHGRLAAAVGIAGLGGEVDADTQTAEQVGRAQAGQAAHRRLEPRREHGRPPQHGGRLAHVDRLLEDRLGVVRLGELRAGQARLGGQKRHVQGVVGRVAMNEVEHAVAAGVQPGGDACPGHFALRRVGHREAPIAVLGYVLAQVRQPAGVVQTLERCRVKGV